jgi:long-chain acyl-CoA synthetase
MRGHDVERIWLKHYPPGVPADIDPSRYSSLVALFDESFSQYRNGTAFIGMDKGITFGEVEEMSRAFGAWLQARGLKRGARVAVMMPNCLAYPIALAAILRAGFTVVNVNPLYTPRELEFQLNDSGAEAIVVLENFAATLQQALPRTGVKHVVIAHLGDLLGILKGAIVNFVVRRVKKLVAPYALPQATAFADALAAGRSLKLSIPDVQPSDIAVLQYTGGTTGVAKGAMLTHRNLVANLLQVEAWLRPQDHKAKVGAPFIITAALPLYHIFAFTAGFLLTMRIGATTVLVPNPRDLPDLIAKLVKHPPVIFPAVNTLFNALMHHKDFGKIDWSRLGCCVGGGMAVQKAVADRWFKMTRHPIVEAYGLSETSPGLTANRTDISEWTGTIGFPFPGTEISIRDEDGHEVPLGERGEICARGPQVMAGYWNRPDETALVMTADGFFRTGDIGIMDEMGRTRIVDRKKDMIMVSGFKVYPNEVEDVIAAHPGVLEVAAIGVPDEHSGEAVKLYVVKKDPALTERVLLDFAASQLTGYKRPRHVEFRNELPKTNVGKILRRALRDEPAKTAA